MKVSILLVTLLAAVIGSATGTQLYMDRALEREGLGLRVKMQPVGQGNRVHPERGEDVELRLSIRRLADGQPLSNLPIGAWLDREVSPLSGAVPVCGQRVAEFLSGSLLTRPLVDLTGYWVITMDREGSISVLDPAVVFAGRSSLYKAIQLGGRPFDWVKTPDDAQLFVALPEQRAIAMVDLRRLQLQRKVAVPGRPTRLALQPDRRLMWAALRAESLPDAANHKLDSTDRLVALDALTGDFLHHINLPIGHHEIAFSEDSRYAYVSSRDAGRLQVIETASGDTQQNVELGGQLLSIVSLSHPRRIWVIDGEQGVVHRLDGQGKQVDRVVLSPGLGPARSSPDGRHVLIVNPMQHQVHILSAHSAEVLNTITISGQPYDVMFSELYAYVRALDSDQVALFPLAQLPDPEPQYIAAGTAPLSATPDLPIASSMTTNYEQTGAFFVVPSERTVYHYMEGMNAPDRSLRTYGHTPLAAMVAQRGLREVAPGEYAATFQPPASGRMVLALAADSPIVRECIGVQVEAPLAESVSVDNRVHWAGDGLVQGSTASEVTLRFVVETAEGNPVPGLALIARVVSGHGGNAATWPVVAGELPGEYTVSGRLARAGGYFVHVESIEGQALEAPAHIPATVVIVALDESAKRISQSEE